jgi:glycosyltransferase involved in cell wall biosynthesis
MNPPCLLEKLAIVVPRYGKSLGGGAETLMRELAHKLIEHGVVKQIEVWTTCALDHRTWENVLPAGVEQDELITVRRFPVDPRDLEVFIRAEQVIHQRLGLHINDQLSWLAESVNSKALYSHIAKNGESFDLILFAPYLFATTFWGAMIFPERSAIVPCLHDEPYAYLEIFNILFHKVRGLIFNAQAEGELANRLYGLGQIEAKGGVVGMGFEPIDKIPLLSEEVRQKINNQQFILYSGRKEQGKNLDLLIENYRFYIEQNPSSNLLFVIIGSGEINFCQPLPSGVLDLGFVSEEQKKALMHNALVLCQPSTNESFSIVLMESWQLRTPVLVHADCAVTKEHVCNSSGGLYFANREEFNEILKIMQSDKNLRDTLGIAGEKYVSTVYSWSAVVARFIEACKQMNYEFMEQVENEARTACI